MGQRPNVQPLSRAVSVLSLQIAEQLASEPALTPSQALSLTGRLHELAEQVLWLRTASVALARRTDPRCRWSDLALATGVTDSTLESRLARWEGRGQ